ncbi:MAG TPA: NAD(P)H-hydrate dehydratase [Oculatellaceae cyanobacterium]
MRLPSRIPTTEQIRGLEASFIKDCDARWGQVLMEIAGRGAASVALQVWQETGGEVVVFCGRGNNGGDGMVVARYLHLWSVPVSVVLVPSEKDEPEFQMSTDEGNANRALVQKFEIPLTIGKELPASSAPSLIVDALLGTGITREVKGAHKTAIDSINLCPARVVSIDLPSGVHSDSGQSMGASVRADRTVTFGYLKAGLLHEPGGGLAGDITVVDIGLPNLQEDQRPFVQLSFSEWIRDTLPFRPTDSHKGTYGTVLTIAGSLGMTGATMLASESALRVGGGLVLLAVPRSLIGQLPSKEVIYRALPETEAQSIALKALDALDEDLEKASAIILGPGISTVPETVQFVQKFVSEVLAKIKKPCLIDADALNALSQSDKVLIPEDNQIVLTPHPKELSRLMGVSTKDIQADRVMWALKAAGKFNCVVVLKGARTVIADPDQNVFINPTGNPGMATAGSGDVLSGTIGGLLAQGLDPMEAAVCGVYLHGFAGDIAGHDIGEAGIVAGDISLALPFAITAVKSGENSALEDVLKHVESEE